MSPQMPDLVKLYIKSCLIGFGIAAIAVAAVLWFDVMGLRGLVLRSPVGWLAVLMLFVANGIVFAGVQFAITIMLMPHDDDDDGNGHRDHIHDPVPVRVGR